ncbi:uncharacterized protein LOC135834607 isoform X2 [Planococcus citri]|uniref:uncharacterized protein LOC135834607 isoform X2 n=1 Tax=Planococcus citri TaxID=170843 RepID=UPI0031F937A5
MDPDKLEDKPFPIWLLWGHLATIAVKNLMTHVFHWLNTPDIAHFVGADTMLVYYIIMGFDFVQFVIFLVAVMWVKKIRAKLPSSLLIICEICIFLDILLTIRTAYELNFSETEIEESREDETTYELNFSETEIEESLSRKDKYKLSRLCFTKIGIHIMSGLLIYCCNGELPATQRDVHCEEGDVSALALNDVFLTRTHPLYPVQPEGNISAAAPTLNAPQSAVIHPQYPVQPKRNSGTIFRIWYPFV